MWLWVKKKTPTGTTGFVVLFPLPIGFSGFLILTMWRSYFFWGPNELSFPRLYGSLDECGFGCQRMGLYRKRPQSFSGKKKRRLIWEICLVLLSCDLFKCLGLSMF